MKRDKLEPLYRKEKKTGLSNRYHVASGGESRWTRHSKQTKKEAEAEVGFKSMKKGQFGYDYTPLYRFLLSQVGHKWDDVYSEARGRLDKDDPIFHLVVRHPAPDESPSKRLGNATYFSTLTVNEAGVLVKLYPNYEMTETYCKCCTHTWNGKVIKPQH